MQQKKTGVILFRRTPPKIRPLMIVLTALALGLLFLGLTLTIVGNWPGYSPYGGNPLKIVGPILLALGIITLIAITVDCCVRANKPYDDYEKEFANFDNSKGSIDPGSAYPSSKGSKPASSMGGTVDGGEKVIPLAEPPPITGSGYPGVYPQQPAGQQPMGQHPYAAKYNNQGYPGQGGYNPNQNGIGGDRPGQYVTGISPGRGAQDPWQNPNAVHKNNGYPQQPNKQAPVYTKPNQNSNPQLGSGGAFKPIEKPTGPNDNNQQAPGRPVSGPKLDSSADSSAPRKLTWGAAKSKNEPKNKEKDTAEGKRTPVLQMPLAVKPGEVEEPGKGGRPEERRWGQSKQSGPRDDQQSGGRGPHKPQEAQKPYDPQKQHDHHNRSRDPQGSHDPHQRSYDSHQKSHDPHQRSRDPHQKSHDPHGSHRSRSKDRPSDARKRGSVNEAFENDPEIRTESTPKDGSSGATGGDRRDRKGGHGSHRGDPRRSKSAGRDPHDRDHRDHDRHRDPHRDPHPSHRSRSSDRPHRRDRDGRYRDMDRSLDSSNSRLGEVEDMVAIDYTSGKPVDRRHARSADPTSGRHRDRPRERSRDRDRSRDRRHAHANPAYDHDSDHRKTSPENPSSSDLSSRHRGHRSRDPHDDHRGPPGVEGVPYKMRRRKPNDLNTSDHTTSMEDLLSEVSTKNTTVVNPSLTINVNAQAGSAVQIALGNQSMPTNPLAKSMIEYTPSKAQALPSHETQA